MESKTFFVRLQRWFWRPPVAAGRFFRFSFQLSAFSLCISMFSYHRFIHFPDSDAAGVVFFDNYLAICHEAYEESLGESGIELKAFFVYTGTIVPISKSSAEYLRPLYCGDKLRIVVKPSALTVDSYAVDYDMFKVNGTVEKLVAHVRTAHVCINSQTRGRKALPSELARWIAAS